AMTTPITPVHTLADTHAGGGLLWAAGEFFTLVTMLLVFFDWANSDTRRGRREDRRGQPPEVGEEGADKGARDRAGEGAEYPEEGAEEEAELVPMRAAPRRPGSTWAQTLAAIRRAGEEEDSSS
ncbi:MAG: hypothetical protein ACRDYC_01935, partial [Acidimicrobiales bacterium]